MKLAPTILAIFFVSATLRASEAQSAISSSLDFQKEAMRLRENALLKLEPQVVAPTNFRSGFNRYPWKRSIVTTVFWVGERPTANNPVPNYKSSWDPRWAQNYGGLDTPEPSQRRNYIPIRFVPRQNPFYVALPYNDVTRGTTKPEARRAIPWFKQAFERPGKSVLKGRWVAIKRGAKICYAQWEDCGPFRTDHWQYVFGNDRPLPNLNQGAGLDVSPAVRDYLEMGGKDVCDWKFVEARDVPNGPWTRLGENNTFVLQRRGANLFMVDRNNAYGARRQVD
ncbi:MAG TPA: hypothetical protein VMS23_03435 [Terrimicrobiaceae bacterium]|jgi:hypothetical protein|nr:hypothetical protein [Terrimicrobiaceae bacterium]